MKTLDDPAGRELSDDAEIEVELQTVVSKSPTQHMLRWPRQFFFAVVQEHVPPHFSYWVKERHHEVEALSKVIHDHLDYKSFTWNISKKDARHLPIAHRLGE